ncbi:OmpA family protein [Sinomicrobium pectinilyticum]|uniref:Flagellar motor protein MotB n=1 Tax=Sinomicrobium pectinilyticum TaxID=1084421 RepID=A0A3N0DQQ5_SINP1|nr:OmpA family protein [Sinomicrobium pectinilyticum]RNL77978.1 flagellar motor protein MotB [Sinomicrobium pectinilyticum]
MYKKLLITLIFVITGSLYAQEARKARADANYEKFAYIKARELYKKLLDQDNASRDLYGKLADTYYFNAQYPEALEYYKKMFALDGETGPEYYFRYAQCLKTSGNHEEAENILNRFYELTGRENVAKMSLTEKLEEVGRLSARYEVKDAGINTEYTDFGPAFYGKDKVIFATARDTGIFVKRTHQWNEKPFLKLYSAAINSEGTLENPEELRGSLNSKYHQSTPTMSSDGRTMYFTRNNYIPGTYGRGEDGVNHLKIYRATFKDGQWKDVEDLPINSNDHSSAHPALSPDGKQLYFVSNRPGTLGLSDLFVTEIRENGSFGPVQHLGDTINTKGRETFPFISDSGVLYFASDGHPGLGGLDIFATIKDPFGQYHVVNVGSPVNSSSDDFGYIINEDTGRGFFSSNRENAMGFDNIYSLLDKEPVSLRAALCGHVQDSMTRAPLAGTRITLYDEQNRVLKEDSTDHKGDFCMEVLMAKNYNLRAEKQDYQTAEEFVDKLAEGEKRKLVVALNKENIAVTTGDDLTEKLRLKSIYFDFDGSAIRKRSEIELAKVIEVMRKHPDIDIEVRSHTDSRGSDTYNTQLSERRAKATIDYIVNKGGISRERVSGRGYGESQLTNSCSDGVKCSEGEHQLNRRSEFIIIKI